MLMETTCDDKGDIDRESFLAEVVNGKQKIVRTLPRVNQVDFAQAGPSCGRHPAGRADHGRLAATPPRRPGHGGDLRAGRGRLHPAVADVADDQLRAGRVRHGAGLLHAGCHAWRRCRSGSRSSSACSCSRPDPRLLLQEAARRPDAAPRRAAAGHRHHRAGDLPEGGRQGGLRRRGAAVPLARPGDRSQCLRRRHLAAGPRRAGRRRRRGRRPCSSSSPAPAPAARCRRRRRTRR